MTTGSSLHLVVNTDQRESLEVIVMLVMSRACLEFVIVCHVNHLLSHKDGENHTEGFSDVRKETTSQI